MDEADFLFSKYDLRRTFEKSLQRGFSEIDSYQADYLLNVSTDDILDHLYDKNAGEPVELYPDDIELCDQGESAEMVNDYGRVINIKRNFYVFAIPFTGESTLFDCQPSSYTLNPPIGKVVGDELHLTFSRTDHDADALKQALDKRIKTIQKYIEWIRRDVEQYNSELRSKLAIRLDKRKSKLLKDKGLVSSLGIPIRQRQDVPITYVTPVKRKRIRVPKPKVNKKDFTPEPALDLKIYDQILDTLRNMVLVMERSPHVFSKLGEEDLRTHFLVQLNGQYEGQATGETFNYEGKTDILIRAEGKNIFIAECKIWKGKKALKSTIDQLLGYLSWRDTKTAILIFNRNKNLTNVLNQIPGVVEKHPNFKKTIPQDKETEFQCVLHSNTDRNRELILTILVFDIPDISS